MSDQSADLGSFIEAAGAGLADAQGAIAGDALSTTAMAVNEATLEARVALDVDATGAVKVQTLDRKAIKSLGPSATSLSTITVNYVALTDVDSGPVGSIPPRDKDEVVATVAERADVKRLAEILGPLSFDATFIPERSAWLVVASDEAGRVVREALIHRED